MDEQFEKTENSMSIYYTVNKMLIALHMALLVFFVVMRSMSWWLSVLRGLLYISFHTGC